LLGQKRKPWFISLTTQGRSEKGFSGEGEDILFRVEKGQTSGKKKKKKHPPKERKRVCAGKNFLTHRGGGTSREPTLIEVQSETKKKGECCHIAAA